MDREFKEIYESPICLETVIILEQVIAGSNNIKIDGSITVEEYTDGGEFDGSTGEANSEFEIKW